jgi:amino acid permease
MSLRISNPNRSFGSDDSVVQSPLLRRSSARRSSRASRASGRHANSEIRRSRLSMTTESMAQRSFLLPEGGIGASVFNLCSATLGAGVLALPKCGDYSGAFLVSLYVFLSGLASAYAIVVLVMVSSRTALMSYEEMSLKILGSKKWVYLSVLLIALLCFGTAVGYIIAIGDILDPFRTLGHAPEWLKDDRGRKVMQVGWWCLFFLPASLPKNVNALRFASCIGVFAIAFLILLMTVHLGSNTNKPAIVAAKGGVNTLFSLPVIMFGYGCQVNTFEIYTEMHDPSVKRMSIAASIAVGVCSAFYILAGVIGYADFGDTVKENILKNFSPTDGSTFDYFAAVAFVGVSVTVTMAFPLCVFPTRDALQFLIWPPQDDEIEADLNEGVLNQSQGGSSAYNATNNGDGVVVKSGGADEDELHLPKAGGHGHSTSEMTERQRVMLVFFICVAILFAGMFIPNITTVFGVIGGVCIGAIGYSIPALFAIRSGHWTVEKVGRVHVVCTWVLFFYGILCATVGTGVSVYHIATS